MINLFENIRIPNCKAGKESGRRSNSKACLLGRAGFTLTELLATIAIMSIVLGVVAGGASTMIDVFKKIKLRADAQTLMSTTVMALSEGMYTASDVEVGDDGKVSSIVSEKSGKLVYSQGQTTGDKPADCIMINGSNVVADRTQTLGLGVSFKDSAGTDTRPVYDENTHMFTFTVTVSNGSIKETREVQIHSIVVPETNEENG